LHFHQQFPPAPSTIVAKTSPDADLDGWRAGGPATNRNIGMRGRRFGSRRNNPDPGGTTIG